jgi:hypothetical protein
MKKLFLHLAYVSFISHVEAQELFKSLNELKEEVAKEEVDKFLKKPTKEGIPGTFLQSFMDNPDLNSKGTCEKENEDEKPHYEVIVVAQGNSKESDLEILPGQKALISTNDLFLLSRQNDSKFPQELTTDSILKHANEFWKSGKISVPPSDFSPHTPLGRELFVEGIIHASAKSGLNEKELSRSIAGVISSVYKSDDEKYLALSAVSLRLYRNYNSARNPGYNNKSFNPTAIELPPGDMTINQIMKGASSFNEFQGGVCNDISEVVAMVGEHLFPDKDVLTVNSGTHFGVLITDGKNTRIIDGGNQLNSYNRLILDPEISSTNLRINKVINGESREIAVVDTEVGQVMEAAFLTGKRLLKTDADISTLMTHLKRENFGLTLGGGKLSDSEVVVVVAKYENAGDKWKNYLGAGASAQKFQSSNENKYQIHFRAGLERNNLHYINSRTEVNFSSGIRIGAMYTLNRPKSPPGSVSIYDISGALDFYNRLEANYGKHNPSGVQLKTSFEVEHSLGPQNWGNTTGALSDINYRDAGAILRNINFHLNQINVDVGAEKKISNGVTGFINTHYQGSHIGQSVSVLGGLSIKVPREAQLLVFTGYTNADIGGYKTKHSLLGATKGSRVGVRYTTRGGVEVGGEIRNIAGERPSVNGILKVPLDGKR